MLKTCKVLFVGVLLAIVPSDRSVLLAEETPSVPAQPAQPSDHTGRVIVVNHRDKTLTVEIDQRLFLFKLDPQVAVVQKGKKVPLDHLLPEQQVVLQLTPTTNGDVQVASITIGHARSQSEAAGGKK